MENTIDTPQSRYLIIVSREKPDLRWYLTQDFAYLGAVEVVLDRRWGERRQGTQAPPEERRHVDRRYDFSGESNLRRHGFKIIRRQEGGLTTDRMN